MSSVSTSVEKLNSLQYELNEIINEEAWLEKRRIHLQQAIENIQCNSPLCTQTFTRVERAYTATTIDLESRPPVKTVSIGTCSEMEQDESRARDASKTLSEEMKLIDSKAYQSELERLQKALDNDRVRHSEEMAAMTKQLNSLTQKGEPTCLSMLSNPSTQDLRGGINPTISALMDRYDTLEDSMKQTPPMQQAISSNNEILQS
jgi:hypothetical protein